MLIFSINNLYIRVLLFFKIKCMFTWSVGHTLEKLGLLFLNVVCPFLWDPRRLWDSARTFIYASADYFKALIKHTVTLHDLTNIMICGRVPPSEQNLYVGLLFFPCSTSVMCNILVFSIG